MKNVLVAIPTYNESASIQEVIEGIEKVAKSGKHGVDILVLDDMSVDGTVEIVKRMAREYGNITLSTGQKQGIGKAYLRGFRHVIKHTETKTLVMMDGDLSHDPAEIPKLLGALKDADYIIGSRYVPDSILQNDWPLRRRIISRVANKVTKYLVGRTDGVKDSTGGFKALRVSALKEIDIDEIEATGYFFQVALLHAFLKHGYRVEEIPITFSNRRGGSSKLRLRDIFEFIYVAYKLDPEARVQKIVRFGLVGACGTVVNLAVLTLLVQMVRLEVLIAAVIAIEVSIVFNFFANHLYTFKGFGSFPVGDKLSTSKPLLLKLLKFNLGSIGGAIIAFTTFSLLFKLLGVPYVFADLIAIIVAMGWNYYMSTRYVWHAIDG